MQEFIESHIIRQNFAKAMSHMYREEVPAYGTLIQLVESVNQETLQKDPQLKHHLQTTNQFDRISEERHGAIRVGTAEELNNIRRMFAVMGMYPVGYYDLSVSGLPVHSTAFRPVRQDELNQNPFRIFTSLLRLDLIQDHTLRKNALDILQTRSIFTPSVLELIEQFESCGGLTASESQKFVKEALETFRWHQDALVPREVYDQLHAVHPLIADIVSFHGPHINHLTPRTLNIDACQEQMPQHNIDPKAVIEGPPARKCPILLRQTSFKALSEKISFVTSHHSSDGKHTARFGEIEQRGIALTPKGRLLYDQLLDKVRVKITPAPDGSNAKEYYQILQKEFSVFPDSHQELHQQELAYYSYHLQENVEIPQEIKTFAELQESGLVKIEPITYEDFLPVSAAGIFLSNLNNQKEETQVANPNKQKFEEDLKAVVIDEFELYDKISHESKQKIEALLHATNKMM